MIRSAPGSQALGKVVNVLFPPRQPENGRVHGRDVAVQVFR